MYRIVKIGMPVKGSLSKFESDVSNAKFKLIGVEVFILVDSHISMYSCIIGWKTFPIQYYCKHGLTVTA